MTANAHVYIPENRTAWYHMYEMGIKTMRTISGSSKPTRNNSNLGTDV
jgi:hypothetical protein